MTTSFSQVGLMALSLNALGLNTSASAAKNNTSYWWWAPTTSVMTTVVSCLIRATSKTWSCIVPTRDCAPNLMWWYIYDLPANFLISREMARIRQGGISRKQSKHLQKARDTRGKEDIPVGPLLQPPLSPKSRALADNVRLRAEVKQMKNKQKNAARREKQLKKKNAELKNKVDEALHTGEFRKIWGLEKDGHLTLIRILLGDAQVDALFAPIVHQLPPARGIYLFETSSISINHGTGGGNTRVPGPDNRKG
ncbi:hypothetical protein C8F04DRAFT_1187683 [Mycena alexandri]|uniref:Uncharacterized protein n=1 Tax=Mycena alexandri TaxID=1745969 RepID=A0AAD6WW05_9AGAR|nr:hypothetical protein C8F04DRAFT_1187683 [Mycena alexandri]